MKISLNSIRGMNRRYGCAEDIAPDGIDKLVEKIGAQLGAVEEVVDLGKLYEGIVIAKVVSCVEHDNSDHLRVCKVDDGGKIRDVERDENGHVQVVCGAPNVREGLTVAWIPPGITVPSTVGKEPLVLEERDIRGQKSNGMLASARELAISDNHDGILEIEEDISPGTSFAEKYALAGDYIIDIENKMFTHRPDCFGFLGVARELAGIQSMPFKSPEWYQVNPTFPDVETEALQLKVKNELPELVPRYTAVAMRDVQVKQSPLWLQVELSKAGFKSINNIVDYTNFFMLETGQPLHAYDYDKVMALDGSDKATIVVRQPKKGEKIKLLNGKEIEPREKAIMIATEQKLIGLAGVMGGADTEVDDSTKHIIIECATIDMYSIRRTSMEHGLFTDAVTRFTKGQSPLQNLAILAKIVDEITKFAGGKVASAVIDSNPQPRQNRTVQVTADFINERLGLKLSADEMAKLLSNVEFQIAVSGESLSITAPFWRTDIEIPEDIVEEIGRLYGYDKLPLELPKRDLTPAPKDPMLELKAKLREQLSQAGANEVLTYTFVHGNLLDKVGQNRDNAFQLSNALSPELQYYRQSLLPSLLEKVHPNIKAGYDEFALFEINQTHAKDLMADGLPIEEYRLGFVFAADNKLASQKYSSAPYYQARIYLTNLLAELGITNLVFEKTDNYQPKLEVSKSAIAPFEKTRTSIVKTADGQFIGELGEFNATVKRNLKLPQFAAGFELDVKQLLKLQKSDSTYVALPRFPKVAQDICLKVATDLSYQELFHFVEQEIENQKPKQTYATIHPIDIFERDDDPDHKQVTFRLEIASYEKTMTDSEVNNLLDHIAETAKQKFAAERV